MLLFWNGKSADDKAVHDALAKVNRWDGRVYVGSAPIKKIAKYGRITRGVDVEQSPTIVVADNQLRAETLVGYVDADDDRPGRRGRIPQHDRALHGPVPEVGRQGLLPVLATSTAALPNFYWRRPASSADARVTRYDRSVQDFIAAFRPSSRRSSGRRSRPPPSPTSAPSSSQIARLGAAVSPKSSRADFIAAEQTYHAAAKAPTRPSTSASTPRACSAAARSSEPRLDSPLVESLREHLEHPAGRGLRPAGAHDGTAGGAACGDLIRISLRIEGERVTAAGFDASGCGTMTAAGSAAVTLVDGAHVLDAARVGAHAIADELGGLSPGQVPRRRPGRRRAAPCARPGRAGGRRADARSRTHAGGDERRGRLGGGGAARRRSTRRR